MRAWLAAVERRTGKRPIVYTKPGFRRAHLRNVAGRLPTLDRRVRRRFALSTGGTSGSTPKRGRVAGIANEVDFDRFNGSPVELHRLALVPGERLAER
ncbi:MAG TPA: hypothetical protein VGO40_11520 [Longimicrobium sp.]|nr:hypothetical protein [Longimicrobium sp.]